MEFLDLVFGKKKNEPQTISGYRSTSPQSVTKSTPFKTNDPKIESKTKTASTVMEPFIFISDCHQRYENSSEVPKDIVKGYIFNLVESYYNNAGYVPKNTLDEIFSQCYIALSNIGQQNIFSSKDELFYEMYFCFLNN